MCDYWVFLVYPSAYLWFFHLKQYKSLYCHTWEDDFIAICGFWNPQLIRFTFIKVISKKRCCRACTQACNGGSMLVNIIWRGTPKFWWLILLCRKLKWWWLAVEYSFVSYSSFSLQKLSRFPVANRPSQSIGLQNVCPLFQLLVEYVLREKMHCIIFLEGLITSSNLKP